MTRTTRTATALRVAAVATAVTIAGVAWPTDSTAAEPADPPVRELLFSGQGNELAVYGNLRADDPTAVTKQIVIEGGDEGEVDINAQICFDPLRPRRFIGGEDTGQPERPAGWGYFEVLGNEVGSLRWAQHGKLTPTYQEHRISRPENYGCGFLSDGRLLTTDVGDQYPPVPGNGQLIVWLRPYTRGDVDIGDPRDDDSGVTYCKIDVSIDTAGGLWVGGDDTVYVASNRVGADDDPGGIFRYSGDWPTSDTAAGGCGRTDDTGAPLVDEGRIEKELFIPADAHITTPSAIWPSGNGTFYVSSVFNGVIAEYDRDGAFVREIMRPPPGETPPYPSTGTPYGIVVGADGTIYYADLGIGPGPPPGPGDDTGSVRRIRFEDGEPRAPEVVDGDLPFPDGVGLFTVPAGPSDDAASAPAPGRDDSAPPGLRTTMPATGAGAGALALALLVLAIARPTRPRR